MTIQGGYPNIQSIHCHDCKKTFTKETDVRKAYGNRFICSCGNQFRLHVKVKSKGKEFEHTAIVVSGEDCGDYEGYSICYNGTIDHSIIKVEELENNTIVVAVKELRRVKCDPDSMWCVIIGGWY